MQELTYDPIVERRALPAVRLINPLRPPDIGQALVLVPRAGEPLTIHRGGTVPSAWLGGYQYSYLVDITEHRLLLSIPLLSKDPSFAFRGSVGFIARVDDPVEVVMRGIHDVGGALREPTKQSLRQVSREFDIAQFHEAEYALNAAVRGFAGDAAIRLRNVTVELVVDDDEVIKSGRRYRDVERDTRLGGKRRDRHLDMLRRDGVEGLLAEIMESDGAHAVLDRITDLEASEREELMKALNTVLNHTDPHREPFDLLHAEQAVLDRLMDGSTAPFGGTRPGRIRSTIRPELGAGPTTGSRDAGGDSGRDDHDRGRRPRDRATVRGSVFSEADRDTRSEPPEDEPDGGFAADKAPPTVEDAVPGRPNGTPRRASRVRGTPSQARDPEEPPR